MAHKYSVYLILDNEIKKEVLEFAVKEHCWYVDSTHNTDIVKELINEKKVFDDDKLLTSFTVKNNTEETLYDIVDAIMRHHNEYTDPPGINILHVLGFSLNDALEAYLREYGFSEFKDNGTGFVAYRV